MSKKSKVINAPAIISVILIACSLVTSTKTEAAESGVSFYLPGLYGDIAVAVPPAEGFYLLATSLHYQSRSKQPLLPNQIDDKVSSEVSSHLLRGFWVPDETLLGANIMMGFRVITLNVDVTADVNTPGGLQRIEDSNSGLGDLSLLPLSLYWQIGDLYLNLYHVINIPTGQYDKTRFSNLALNHWAFDTVLGITWLNPKAGIEISVAPGLIYNTENKDTNYQTGIEFHMDAMFNLYLSQSLSVGLHGSVYHQLTGDKGGHPSLGSFKGRALTIGPAITWFQDIGNQKYYLSAKWLHEFNVKNKQEGDLLFFSAGIKF